MAGDADGIAFLKGIGTDQMRRHLAGEHHQRNRIHKRVGNAGDGVGRAWPRGDEHDAHLAGGACIAFGGMDSGLFVAHKDVADPALRENRIVNRQYGAARIAEDDFDTQIGQRLHDNRRA